MIRVLQNIKPNRFGGHRYLATSYHRKEPEDTGLFDPEKKNIGTGLVFVAEGGIIKLQINVDSSGIVTDTSFNTYGCNSATASGSRVTDIIKGKKISDIAENIGCAEHVRLTPSELYYSALAKSGIKSAICDFKNKNCVCQQCSSVSRCHRCGGCKCVSCGCSENKDVI
jgi:nitrogen fixation NifU-like protein